MSQQTLLKTADYAAVGAVLCVSLGIGLFHGIKAKRKSNDRKDVDDVHEYFLAGRTMGFVPVALSFFATTSSSTAVIGPAVESYVFGMQLAWAAAANLPVALVMNKIFIPFFYNMRSMNIYKILEIRYSRRFKELITVLIILRTAMVSSVIVYGTAEACTQAANINLWVIIGTIIVICTVYTSLGGIRGVMWTDVFQAVIMLISMAMVIGVGTYHVGGMTNVWRRNHDTERIEFFNLDPNPTTRHTFWGNFVGLSVMMTAAQATSQANVHRLLTAPSVEIAKTSNSIGLAIQSVLIVSSVLTGSIMYAAYHGCDPLTSKSVQNMNQLVPRFAVDVLGSYPVLVV